MTSICSSVSLTLVPVLARATRDVRGPELRSDAALAQPRDVGVQRLLRPADVDGAEGQVLLLAELVGQVVVPIDEQGLAMDGPGLVGQDDRACVWRLGEDERRTVARRRMMESHGGSVCRYRFSFHAAVAYLSRSSSAAVVALVGGPVARLRTSSRFPASARRRSAVPGPACFDRCTPDKFGDPRQLRRVRARRNRMLPCCIIAPCGRRCGAADDLVTGDRAGRRASDAESRETGRAVVSSPQTTALVSTPKPLQCRADRVMHPTQPAFARVPR